MTVTVKVNGASNSLVHKGSMGISTATVPDVCKTPSPGGPVPIPYPNISQSSTLAKGTTTVTADNGQMIAIKGSEFSLSNGDNAGTLGGVKSSTFMKESTWILYSFDVKIEGKNACRLTDKKFQNHENTVDMAGVLQTPVTVLEVDLQAMATDCHDQIEKADKKKKASAREGCRVKGIRMHKCCSDALNDLKAQGKHPNVHSEYSHKDCRLDVMVCKAGAAMPVKGSDVTKVYDFKFNCTGKPKMAAKQERKYLKRFPLAKITLVGP